MSTYCLTYKTTVLYTIHESQNKGIRKNKKIFTKKGRRMGSEGRRIVENRKERQKGRVTENDRKRGNY